MASAAARRGLKRGILLTGGIWAFSASRVGERSISERHNSISMRVAVRQLLATRHHGALSFSVARAPAALRSGMAGARQSRRGRRKASGVTRRQLLRYVGRRWRGSIK
jgi:hypothetical protein